MIKHPQVTSTGKVKGTSVSIRRTTNGTYRIRLDRVALPKNERTQTRPTIEEAVKCATGMQAKCDGNKTKTRASISQKDEFDYAEIIALVEEYKNDWGASDPLTQTSKVIRAIDLVKRGAKLNGVISAAKAKASEHDCNEVSYMREADVLGIIEKELNRITERHIKPYHDEVIGEYMQFVESGKQRKNKSKQLSLSTIDQSRTNSRKIERMAGKFKVGNKCDMEETRELLIDQIEAGAHFKNGTPHSINTKHHIAKEYRKFGEWLVLKGHTDDNPYDDFAQLFPPDKEYDIETYPVDEIETLLAFVMTEEKYQKYLPALAMMIFCTVRPTEIGWSKDNFRRFNYSQFRGFQNIGLYGDYMVHMPVNGKRIDSEGNIPSNQSATKLSTPRQASLSPNGYEFIKYYWENIMGSKIPSSRKPIMATRMEWEHHIFAGSHKWNPDGIFAKTGIVKLPNGFRHTVATMNHKKNPNIGYWTECMGDSPKVFKRHYQNTDVSLADAKRFFALTPASILARTADNVITGAVA